MGLAKCTTISIDGALGHITGSRGSQSCRDYGRELWWICNTCRPYVLLPDEFVCGVDIVGPSNLITLLESFPPYWKTITAMMTTRVGDVETEQEFLKSCSPLFLADRIVSPLLIGQVANDPRVKQAESDQVVDAMRKNGKPVEYLLFPDEGHGFARPENRLKFFAAAESFLAKYLGGRVEAPSEAENADEMRR